MARNEKSHAILESLLISAAYALRLTLVYRLFYFVYSNYMLLHEYSSMDVMFIHVHVGSLCHCKSFRHGYFRAYT